MDKVESNICLGCSSFNSTFGPIEPGFCGCNKKKLVEDIVEELRKRINYFNNKTDIESKTNEINLLKNILDNFNSLNLKVDKIIEKIEIGNEKLD